MPRGNPRPVKDRFFPKVGLPSGEFECMEWLGYISPEPRGYGQLSIGNRPVPAHRVAYEVWVGPIPDGLSIDHLCRNRRCVRPDHLEAVPIEENVRRGSVGKWEAGCPQGHPRTPENTYEHGGRRYCAECQRQRSKQYRERKARGD